MFPSISTFVVTVIPLSNSPVPLKFNELPDEKALPWSLFPVLFKDIPADPVTSIAPAKAEVAIREVPKAVKPTFLIMFILNTPYFYC